MGKLTLIFYLGTLGVGPWGGPWGSAEAYILLRVPSIARRNGT